MAISTIASFRDLLAQTRLVTTDEFAALLASAPTEDPRAFAKTLVSRGVLTRWQAEQLWAGQRQFLLGKYRILDKLGSGGMGAVYRARQNSTGRIVAVKVMSKKLVDNPDSVARFHREAQSAAALNHPNIVAAYDAGEADGTYFLVMEHVAGRDLNDWLKAGGRLPIDWVCECIRQAALGLQHAHERGLVHRDIKPGNLLVIGNRTDEVPHVKILDMGLARLASEQGVAAGELTHTGQILGTPDYIAPEQAKSTKTADIRADIFSLGCTLFKLLTGSVPFSGESLMEKLMSRASEDAPPASSRRADIPARLDAVIAQMLARQTSRRFQLPCEVAEALAPYAMGYDGPLPDGAPDRSETSESSSAELRSFLGNLDNDDTPASPENSPLGITTGHGAAVLAVQARPEVRTASPAPLNEPVVVRRFEAAHAAAPRQAPTASVAAWAGGAACLAIVLGITVWQMLPGGKPPARLANSASNRSIAPVARPVWPDSTTQTVPPTVSGPSTSTPSTPPPAKGFSPPQPCPGKFGQGMRFLGREAIVLPHRSDLEPREFTLETWVWLDQLPSGKETRRWLINKSTNEHATGYFSLAIESDRVIALVNLGGGSNGVVRARSDAGLLKTGRWQHLAITCGSTSLTVWCNGQQVATQALVRPRPAGAGPLVIGSRADEYGQFQGQMDEIRVFARILTPDELRQHAQCEDEAAWRATDMAGGLIEAWDFER